MEKLRRLFHKMWKQVKKHKAKCIAVAAFVIGYYATKIMKNYRYTSLFLKLIESDKIGSVVIYGMFIGYKVRGSPNRFLTHRSMLSDSDLFNMFKQHKVTFTTFPIEDRLVGTILIGVILPAVVMTWAMKKFMMPKDKKQKYFEENDNRTMFKDIGGNDIAKESLQEIIDYIKNPSFYQNLGVRLPKGVLLYGPPGTGKTLLAKAVANECNVPFIYACGSDFVEIFVGQGPKRIREMFSEARRYGKCVIFIDEIDSLGFERNKQSLCKESDNTLNQLLSEMDGFSEAKGVTVIGATNQADIIDSALLRPGRFDRKIEIKLPDEVQRFDILNIHMSKRKMAVSDRAVQTAANLTIDFTGSELENVANEASFLALKRARLNPAECYVKDEDLINSCKKAVEDKIKMDELKGKKNQNVNLENFYRQFLITPTALNR
jgi:cell division protease FtsH